MKINKTATAIIVFLAINLALAGNGLSASGESKKDAIQKSLAEATAELQKQAGAEPVVLIGSSLILAPLWSVDVAHGKFFKDCMQHHTSNHLEKLTGCPVVSLATAGQFVSDTYLITEKLLNEKQHPKVLIYGVAPRDFMDDTTGGLAMTSVFDSLVETKDFPKINKLFFNNFDERGDFVLNRSVFLYRKRGRYQAKMQDFTTKLGEKVLAHVPLQAGSAVLASNITAASNIGDTNASAAATASGVDPLANFLLGGDRDAVWKQSIEEYAKRYKRFNAKQFEKQKECFRALTALCAERKIKLCVVAMPLTDDNRKLMPADLYQQYRSFVKEATSEAAVPFVDLQDSKTYDDSNFYDTVHLNSKGGERFLSAMSNLVKEQEHAIATGKPASKTY
ncbi:hypothetical protein BH11CYA1_BH11CYA1_09770 [soil metagenome]